MYILFLSVGISWLCLSAISVADTNMFIRHHENRLKFFTLDRVAVPFILIIVGLVLMYFNK